MTNIVGIDQHPEYKGYKFPSGLNLNPDTEEMAVHSCGSTHFNIVFDGNTPNMVATVVLCAKCGEVVESLCSHGGFTSK